MAGVIHRYRGPLFMGGLALALFCAAALHRAWFVDLGDINLTPGATKRAAFQVGYAELYAVGIRMDQKVAEQLYPCTVSMEAMQWDVCKHSAAVWPIKLTLKLSADGRALSDQIIPAVSMAGGEYEDNRSYTWVAAYARLAPGPKYSLEVRSVGGETPLRLAKPRLVVTAAGAPGLLETIALNNLIALAAGIMLTACALVWALILARRQRHSGG